MKQPTMKAIQMEMVMLMSCLGKRYSKQKSKRLLDRSNWQKLNNDTLLSLQMSSLTILHQFLACLK